MQGKVQVQMEVEVTEDCPMQPCCLRHLTKKRLFNTSYLLVVEDVHVPTLAVGGSCK